MVSYLLSFSFLSLKCPVLIRNVVYITPSGHSRFRLPLSFPCLNLVLLLGVEKERLKPEHIFCLNPESREVLKGPPTLKLSDCSPLFFLCHEQRNAGCCIHTHSIWANLASIQEGNEFRIKDQEMIKGPFNALRTVR